MTEGNSKEMPKAKGNSGEFKVYKATVHLKHTGTELICDVLGFHEREQALTVRDPCVLTAIPTESGKSQMALVPFLMTTKENIIHIALTDILFVADARDDIGAQHTQMHSSIIQPQKSNLIVN